MRKLLLTLSLCILLSACQPTPESPIVVGKQNDGWRDSVILTPSTSETDTPLESQDVEYFTAPTEFTSEPYESEKLTINYDAEVVYPENSVFPIYLMKERDFTQEEADAFLDVLIGDGYFHDATNVVTKEVIEQSIKSYQSQLQWASEEGDSESVEFYTQQLNELYVQLEAAPETETLTPALRTFSTKPTDRLTTEYVDMEKLIESRDSPDQPIKLEMTEEDLRRAEADGAEAISGYAALPTGKLGYLHIYNDKGGSGVHFDGTQTYQMDVRSDEFDEPMTFEEAQSMAEETLTSMGVNYDFIRYYEDDFGAEEGFSAYSFEYGIVYPNVDLNFAGMPAYRESAQEYGESIKQETVSITIKGGEVIHFTWNDPIELVSSEGENTKLLPFDEIESIIGKGMEIYYIANELMSPPGTVSTEFDVAKVALNYMQVKKENDSDERYYIPVWDVLGYMTEVYKGDVGTSSEGQILERRMDEMYNLLTINAIDGTFIDRSLGY